MTATKKEISETLNELLGIDVDWTKMTKEDLIDISRILAEPSELIKKLSSEEDKREITRKTLIDRGINLVRKRDGPIIDLLKDFIGEED